jgi:hypothetical protein
MGITSLLVSFVLALGSDLPQSLLGRFYLMLGSDFPQ